MYSSIGDYLTHMGSMSEKRRRELAEEKEREEATRQRYNLAPPFPTRPRNIAGTGAGERVEGGGAVTGFPGQSDRDLLGTGVIAAGGRWHHRR